MVQATALRGRLRVEAGGPASKARVEWGAGGVVEGLNCAIVGAAALDGNLLTAAGAPGRHAVLSLGLQHRKGANKPRTLTPRLNFAQPAAPPTPLLNASYGARANAASVPRGLLSSFART